MNKIFDRLFFTGPMSLGDAIVSSGIVHYYADRSNELHYPALPNFYETLNTLFKDSSNINVIPLLPYDQGEDQYVRDNNLSRILRPQMKEFVVEGHTLHPLWDMQFYEHYDLPFSLRYTNFRLPNNIEGSEELYQTLSGGEPYILVHRFSGHHPGGIPIDIIGFRSSNGLPDIKIIEITEGITNNMMQYVTLIERAQEIHCVPSSFFCLVDSIWNRTNAALFYHDVRATTMMRINSEYNKNRWNIVEYANKL